MIDCAAVPPATSPWTFLVPALGAFLGVVLAQWWTSRREKRQWERQMELYATQWADQRERDKEERNDQRRRDAEQREDQRKRDRELWEREDRHRFTQDKRTLYGDLLNECAESLHALSEVQDALIFGDGVHDGELHTHRERLSVCVAKIDLVAPGDICDQARDALAAFTIASRALSQSVSDLTPERDTEYSAKEATFRKGVRNLRIEMREDLGIWS